VFISLICSKSFRNFSLSRWSQNAYGGIQGGSRSDSCSPPEIDLTTLILNTYCLISPNSAHWRYFGSIQALSCSRTLCKVFFLSRMLLHRFFPQLAVSLYNIVVTSSATNFLFLFFGNNEGWTQELCTCLAGALATAWDMPLGFFFFFETDSHYVAQAGLQLMILRSHLPTAGITGVHYHTWFSYIFSFLIILPKEVPCLHPHLLPLVHSIFC
jgi:hypothetical protein